MMLSIDPRGEDSTVFMFDYEKARKLLKERGWTQFDLALQMAWRDVETNQNHIIRPEYLSKILAGKHQPGTSHIRRMAEAFGLHTDDLLKPDPRYTALPLDQ